MRNLEREYKPARSAVDTLAAFVILLIVAITALAPPLWLEREHTGMPTATAPASNGQAEDRTPVPPEPGTAMHREAT